MWRKESISVINTLNRLHQPNIHVYAFQMLPMRLLFGNKFGREKKKTPLSQLYLSIYYSIKLIMLIIDPIYWILEIKILYRIISNSSRQYTALSLTRTPCSNKPEDLMGHIFHLSHLSPDPIIQKCFATYSYTLTM
jgi:hypothetical protein